MAFLRLPRDELINQMNMPKQMPGIFQLVIISKINVLIPERENGRRLYSYKRGFYRNEIT